MFLLFLYDIANIADNYNIEGKTLQDQETLKSVGLEKGGRLYFKDLGHQIGWSTVSNCLICIIRLHTHF